MESTTFKHDNEFKHKTERERKKEKKKIGSAPNIVYEFVSNHCLWVNQPPLSMKNYMTHGRCGDDEKTHTCF